MGYSTDVNTDQHIYTLKYKVTMSRRHQHQHETTQQF